MKIIALTKGRYAMVDDEDYDWLSQWTWYAKKSRVQRVEPIWYAHRVVRVTAKTSSVYMHREIALRCGFTKETDVDHRDGNGLNNQRSNIRPCTQTQNNGNRRKQPGTTSQFKGVAFCKSRGNWEAKLGCEGKVFHIGRFKTEQDAARAYDLHAKVHFGEFARLNFP